MAKIRIENELIDVPDDATPEELDAIASHHDAERGLSLAGRATEMVQDVGAFTAGSTVGLPFAKPTVERFQALPPDTQENLLKSIAPVAAATAITAPLAAASTVPAAAAFGARALAMGGRAAAAGLGAGAGEATRQIQSATVDGQIEPSAGTAARKIGGEALAGAGMSAGLETGVSAVAKTVGGVRSLYRNVLAIAKGVGKRVVSRALDAAEKGTPELKESVGEFFDAISKRRAQAGRLVDTGTKKLYTALAEERSEAAAGLKAAETAPVPGAAPDEVVTKAVNLAEKLRQVGDTLAERAGRHLKDATTISKNELINAATGVMKSLETSGVLVGKAAQTAANAVQSFADDVAKLPGTHVSEKTLRQLIMGVDDNLAWGGEADKLAVSTLRQLRHRWDVVLKRNTAYQRAMKPASEMFATAEEFEKALSLTREKGRKIIPTNATYTALNSMFKGGKPVSAAGATARGHFTPTLEEGRQFAEGTKAKEAAVSAAQSRLEIPTPITPAIEGAKKTIAVGERAVKAATPDAPSILRAAQSAAAEGPGGPAEMELASLVQKFAPGKSQRLTAALIDAAAKGLFSRGEGGGSASILANLADVLAKSAESTLPGVTTAVDRLLGAIESASRSVKPYAATGVAIEKSLKNTLLKRGRSNGDE